MCDLRYTRVSHGSGATERKKRKQRLRASRACHSTQNTRDRGAQHDSRISMQCRVQPEAAHQRDSAQCVGRAQARDFASLLIAMGCVGRVGTRRALESARDLA